MPPLYSIPEICGFSRELAQILLKFCLFGVAEAEQDVSARQGEQSVGRLALARRADAAGIEQVDAALGIVFLMRQMRMSQITEILGEA